MSRVIIMALNTCWFLHALPKLGPNCQYVPIVMSHIIEMNLIFSLKSQFFQNASLREIEDRWAGGKGPLAVEFR